MRYLILSDLHSNWEALQTVIDSAAGHFDRVLCLGDLAGYGANPNEVIHWVRSHAFAVVRGNHDRACAGLEDLEWFNPVARAAAEWTHSQLTPENLAYLAALPKGPIAVDSFQVMHGSPLDEDEYMIAASDAGQSFPYLESPVAFFGHTHVQGGFEWVNNRVLAIGSQNSRRQKEIILDLDPDGAYLVNPGSVGQPRDGDPRAAYAVLDTHEGTATFYRASYPIDEAQRRIRARGLPEMFAERLALGL